MHPVLPLATWAAIRHDYENTERTVEEICAEHGISSGTLRDRMRRWKWTRRRPPIPDEGPLPLWPARAAPAVSAGVARENTQNEATPLSIADGAALSDAGDAHPPQEPLSFDAPREPESPAEFAQRLQGAVGRVLPAIEAAVSRVAATTHPRELERTARTLTALTRTLRELTTLSHEHPPPTEKGPANLQEFRAELARKIDNLIASRNEEEALEAARDDHPAG